MGTFTYDPDATTLERVEARPADGEDDVAANPWRRVLADLLAVARKLERIPAAPVRIFLTRPDFEVLEASAASSVAVSPLMGLPVMISPKAIPGEALVEYSDGHFERVPLSR